MDNEKKNQASSVLRDFIGQMSDVNPERIPVGGTEVQINIFCKKTGMLETRSGLQFISLTIIDE